MSEAENTEVEVAETAAEVAEAAPTATICVKEGNGHRTEHQVGVNGQFVTVPVGKNCDVTAETLAALDASHIEYDTISPLPETEDAEAGAVEGSSAPAASTDEGKEPSTEASDDTGGDTGSAGEDAGQ